MRALNHRLPSVFTMHMDPPLHFLSHWKCTVSCVFVNHLEGIVVELLQLAVFAHDAKVWASECSPHLEIAIIVIVRVEGVFGRCLRPPSTSPGCDVCRPNFVIDHEFVITVYRLLLQIDSNKTLSKHFIYQYKFCCDSFTFCLFLFLCSMLVYKVINITFNDISAIKWFDKIVQFLNLDWHS